MIGFGGNLTGREKLPSFRITWIGGSSVCPQQFVAFTAFSLKEFPNGFERGSYEVFHTKNKDIVPSSFLASETRHVEPRSIMGGEGRIMLLSLLIIIIMIR